MEKFLMKKDDLPLYFRYTEPIEKPPEMPYKNLLCLQRICLFVYVCSITKNEIIKPCDKKFDGILVNDDNIVNIFSSKNVT